MDDLFLTTSLSISMLQAANTIAIFLVKITISIWSEYPKSS